MRYRFYEKPSIYACLLALYLFSLDFINSKLQRQIEKHKIDLSFFLNLKISVKRRYSNDIDYREYEPQVKKLITGISPLMGMYCV